jgi:hypothetical protein
VVEQFFGDSGFIETSENHWRHIVGSTPAVFEKTPRSNTIDSVAAFVQRIQEASRRTPACAAPKAP